MKQSAGILLFKIQQEELFVLLVHPGGPFFTKKDTGAWTIPKGEFEEGEEPLATARREFFEEMGTRMDEEVHPLKLIKQKGGKVVNAWAAEGELDLREFRSNTFEMEWPPRSGKKQSFPEVDKAEWFGVEDALTKISAAQQNFVFEIEEKLFAEKRIRSARSRFNAAT